MSASSALGAVIASALSAAPLEGAVPGHGADLEADSGSGLSMALSPAEASRAEALVRAPDCLPGGLVCDQGRLVLLTAVRLRRAAAAADAVPKECRGPLKSAPAHCVQTVSDALSAMLGVDEFGAIEESITGAKDQGWPRVVSGPPGYIESLAGRAKEGLAPDRCPVASLVCSSGRWMILGDLAGAYGGMSCPDQAPDDPHCPARREAGLAWVKQGVLSLLRTSGWPGLPLASWQASQTIGVYLGDPELTSVALPPWKAARREGRAGSYARLADLIEWKAGRKQIYGTLGACEGKGAAAVFEPYPMVEPGGIERRRTEAREPRFADWVAEQTAVCRSVSID